MAFRVVQGDTTAVSMPCASSSTIVRGGLVCFDRTNKYLIPCTASTAAKDTVGVADQTPAASATTLMVIPVRGAFDQLWEWDTTNSTAANQLCIRSLLTDTSTVANTSTDITSNVTIVTPIMNVGVASDKKQRGFITLVGSQLS